jgi:hypothetical protein
LAPSGRIPLACLQRNALDTLSAPETLDTVDTPDTVDTLLTLYRAPHGVPMKADKTPKPIKLDPRNHVEKPLNPQEASS